MLTVSLQHHYTCVCVCVCVCHPRQVVTDSKLADVGQTVVQHVRFALLDMQTLSEIEEENRNNPFIPVSKLVIVSWFAHPLFTNTLSPIIGTSHSIGMEVSCAERCWQIQHSGTSTHRDILSQEQKD